MSKLADFFKAQNREFLKVARGQGGLPQIDKKPVRKLAVLTCMDTRLLYIVEPALGLNRGEAVVIKVAGARITEAFDSALGSLLVAVYELGVTDVAVVVHDDCGMVHTTADGLCEKKGGRRRVGTRYTGYSASFGSMGGSGRGTGTGCTGYGATIAKKSVYSRFGTGVRYFD